MSCAEVRLQEALQQEWLMWYRGIPKPPALCVCVLDDGNIGITGKVTPEDFGANWMSFLKEHRLNKMIGLRKHLAPGEIEARCTGNYIRGP